MNGDVSDGGGDLGEKGYRRVSIWTDLFPVGSEYLGAREM